MCIEEQLYFLLRIADPELIFEYQYGDRTMQGIQLGELKDIALIVADNKAYVIGCHLFLPYSIKQSDIYARTLAVMEGTNLLTFISDHWAW